MTDTRTFNAPETSPVVVTTMIALPLIALAVAIFYQVGFNHVDVIGSIAAFLNKLIADMGDGLAEQIGILVTGPFAIWLTHDQRAKWRRWACVIALAGQPFWLVATYEAAQWGMFINSVLFTIGWLRGFNKDWVTPWRIARASRGL